jgi:hypothetical protein
VTRRRRIDAWLDRHALPVITVGVVLLLAAVGFFAVLMVTR